MAPARKTKSSSEPAKPVSKSRTKTRGNSATADSANITSAAQSSAPSSGIAKAKLPASVTKGM